MLQIFHMARKNDLQKLMPNLNLHKPSNLDHFLRVMTAQALMDVVKELEELHTTPKIFKTILIRGTMVEVQVHITLIIRRSIQQKPSN